MREIKVSEITNKIEQMLLETNTCIDNNIQCCLKKAFQEEVSPLGKEVIKKIIENNDYAKENKVPICQDTGMVVCFVEIGYEVHLDGDIYEAINEGVRRAYTLGYLRKSIVSDPFNRVNTKDNTPAIVHIKLVCGDKIKISVMAKGGGSENMSLVKMLIPADGFEGVKKLVLDTVFKAGGKPCPPIIVGIGVGGDFENAAVMAKSALLCEINDINSNPTLAMYESELKQEINKLGIGPMGFGGTVTCLAVKIKTAPCHIASMPVAINIQCHASRHKTLII